MNRVETIGAEKQDVRAALERLVSATLGESGGIPLDSRIGPMWSTASFAAPVYAVSCRPGDNLGLHVAVTTAPAGSALAVDVGGIAERGYWGEVLTRAAQAAGVVALVIDGGVRDTAALEELGFPVFATCVALRGTSKTAGGAVGGEATVGGAVVHTVDWMVGDRDGVTLIAEGRLAEILDIGTKRAAYEEDLFGRLAEGATTLELLSLDPAAVHVGARGPTAHGNAGELPISETSQEFISTAASPVPSGSYSQARFAGGFVFLAGVGPYDPVTRAIVGQNVEEQTDRTMANIEAILVAAGLGFGDVASTVFLADLKGDWASFDKAYGRWFTGPPPARAAVGAVLKNILVEIVMIARARPQAPATGNAVRAAEVRMDARGAADA
jgi:4-hydroxy-4-methyl-2-oxoglutarate aldolase